MGQALDCSAFTKDAIAEAAKNITSKEVADIAGSTVGVDEKPADFLWLIGIGLTLLSSLAVALGSIFQKKAHMKNESLEVGHKFKEFGGLLLSPMWIFGLFLMFFMQLPLTLVALTLASQSLIIPLGGMWVCLGCFLLSFSC